MACSHTDDCELYPQISLSSALKVWQVFYCEGDYEKCVRYQTAAEGRPVPVTLLPNGKELEIESVTREAGRESVKAEAMVSAMREEVAGAPSGSALFALQDAMDVMAKEGTGTTTTMEGATGAADDVISLDLDAEIDIESVSKNATSTPATAKLHNPAISHAGPSSSYYLRMRAEDKTGVMSGVIQVLGRHGITVDAMAQKKMVPNQADTVLIIVTGQAEPSAINTAVSELESLDTVNGNVASIPLEYLDADMFA
jgi:acetolactate synthase regulatory subunit